MEATELKEKCCHPLQYVTIHNIKSFREIKDDLKNLNMFGEPLKIGGKAHHYIEGFCSLCDKNICVEINNPPFWSPFEEIDWI